jgi:hypothetical protein
MFKKKYYLSIDAFFNFIIIIQKHEKSTGQDYVSCQEKKK